MTAGLYIHIPFCEKKCGYCDFYSVEQRDSQIPSFLIALINELNLYSRDATIQGMVFETVYFGGGTPSVLKAEQIHSILDNLLLKFKFVSNPEITVETNPGTVNLHKLIAYRKVGINRLSLGVQTFQPDELKLLERIHTVEESKETFRNARKAGFENISVDLLFALPNQSLKSWQSNLDMACDLTPEHISAYNLTVEKDTPFAARIRDGELNNSNQEVQREMHLTTIEFLQSRGFYQYEISNYALLDFESMHNQKYWDGSFYLGVGPSAHSFIDKRRFWNVSDLTKYIELLTNEKSAVADEEYLNLNTQSFEKILLGLRQIKGINLRAFETDFGFSFFDKYFKQLSRFIDLNLKISNITEELTNGTRNIKGEFLEIEDGFLRLTGQGLLLCDSICMEFI